MRTISKPLSARQVHQYHAQELQNASDNYYTEGDRIGGTWHGQLAARWGLYGEEEETAFHRYRAESGVSFNVITGSAATEPHSKCVRSVNMGCARNNGT